MREDVANGLLDIRSAAAAISSCSAREAESKFEEVWNVYVAVVKRCRLRHLSYTFLADDHWL